jgi:hypothetical protein
MFSGEKGQEAGTMSEKADLKTEVNSHFRAIGYLVPSRNKKAYRVIVGANGKWSCIGLVKKESLLKSLNSTPISTVEISVFADRQLEACEQCTLNGVPLADPEKLRQAILQVLGE